jgi:hypothetical protein
MPQLWRACEHRVISSFIRDLTSRVEANGGHDRAVKGVGSHQRPRLSQRGPLREVRTMTAQPMSPTTRPAMTSGAMWSIPLCGR